MDFKTTFAKLKQTAADTASTVAQTAKEGSAVVAKKSSEFIEISKLTMSIASEESKIKDAYLEIGRKIFEKHEKGQYIDPELLDDCEYIIKTKSNINELKNKIQELKNIP